MRVILMMVQSADGRISNGEIKIPQWTSREDFKLFRQITMKHRAVIMGRITYDTIGHPLNNRFLCVMTKKPDIHKNEENRLFFTDMHPRKLLEYLQMKGFETVVLAGGTTVNSLFLENGLVDEILLTVEPILIGQGPGLCDNTGGNIRLELLETGRLNKSTLFLRYGIIKE